MKRIVLQDSNEDILQVLTLALEMEGFKAFTFSTCDEDFLEHISLIEPNVILLEDKLTCNTFIKIYNDVKKKYPFIPLLILTHDINIHQTYQLKGFDGYIKKPFDLQFLYDLLAKYVKDFNT